MASNSRLNTKEHLSDFNNWNQKEHAEDFILYPKNIGYHLCIDETALSKGELYTILTNRDKHGRKGTIVAIVKGTKAEDVINVLLKIDADKRNQVKEITLDMAGSMQKIAKRCFPGAMQVVDRFHVSKLVYEAVQDLRIAYRWQVMKDENRKIKEAKVKGKVMNLKCLAMEIHSDSCWPEAGTCCLRLRTSGCKARR